MPAVTACEDDQKYSEDTYLLITLNFPLSFRSPVISQVDGPSRPRTAEPRQSHPIWLGGSGPERTHSPGKRFINQNSRFAPFAYHEGSPG